MFSPIVRAHRLIACLLASTAIGAIPGAVLAHAELESSLPAADVSLVESPDALRLTFTEPIDPRQASVELLDPQQRTIEGAGAVEVARDGLTLEVSLPPLEPGVFTVSYQVVSTVDGHATAGIFAFLVDPTGAAPPPTSSEQSSSPSVDPLTLAARWLALAAMLVAFGSVTLWWFAGRRTLAEMAPRASDRPPWRLIGGGAALAAIGIAGYLALSARPINEAGAGGLPFDPAAPFGWTPFAIAMRVAFLAALVTMVLSAIGARRPGAATRPVVAAGVILAIGLAGMGMAGHAAAAGGPLFGAIDWLHLLAVGAWLGALPAALALAWRSGDARATTAGTLLRRHGRVALLAAPLVALTGIANSPLVLGSGRDLVASDYGNLLVAKVLLLSVAVGIGAVNHLALRGRGRAAVAALVVAELVVGGLAVSAAATMVTIQPASARQPELATTPVNPAHLFGEVGPSRVHLSVSLPAPGRQSYLVTVTDTATAAPRSDVQKVFLTFIPPVGSDLEPVRVELEPADEEGLHATTGAHTPLVGEWGVEVTVRREGARDESRAFGLPVISPASAELGPPPDTGIGVPGPIAAAWSLLPNGPLGWLPSLAALAALLGTGRLPPSTVRSVGRGAAVAVLTLATLAAGGRALVAAANAPSAEQLEQATTVEQPPSLERGRGVYLANCASCHGRDGDGDGPVRTLPAAGSLDDAVRRASDAELSYRISYGIAGTPMPAFAGSLTPEERADLVAYLRDRWGAD